ncbi:hypothetical protein CK503_10570 [Aliifodinibius salipaludis]|uniref:Uncharacterized protein n=1 Tax=Fodinibius salipaludis TaxID=2032627 RepID=A0A2A2G7J9_9BACT|nr:hypothetical protein [Aliifodinibius salipaludis]PAU93591.1 hypothetical protein CK503_10570 [Aliifodinibius salipaludis]
MNRQEFRKKLQKCITEDLEAILTEHIEAHFDRLEQLLRYFSAVERKYDTEDIIKLGFPGILKNIEDTLSKKERESILGIYLSAVDRIGEKFPDDEVWKQEEERFVVQHKDPIWIAIAKRSKSTARDIAKFGYKTTQAFKSIFGADRKVYPGWEQKIPLRQAVRYYLLDDKSVLEWGHHLQRVQLNLITDIEDLLVREEDEQKELDLTVFVSDQKKKLEEKKADLLDNVEETLSSKQSQIAEDIEKVGTLEWRADFFDEKRLQTTEEKLENQFRTYQEQWQFVQRLFFERTKDVVQFLKLQSEIGEEIAKFNRAFEDTFRKSLKAPLQEFSTDIKEATEKVGRGATLGELQTLHETFETFVDERLIQPIQKLLDKRILAQKTDHLFEDLLLKVGQSPQEAQLVFDAELDENPPSVNQQEVEWRQLVIRALRELFMNPLQPANQQYEEFLSQNLEEIIEVKNIIAVNFDSALKARDEDVTEKEDPTKVVGEALKRILKKVQELNDRADEKWQQIDNSISEGREKFFSSLLALLHEGDSKQLQLLNAKYRMKEKKKDWQTVLDSRWARVADWLMLWSRFVWKKLKTYGTDLKVFLGFKEKKIQESKRIDIATYLSETDQKMNELPYIYRRLFDFQSLADKRFFEPAQESTVTFKRAYEQWQNKLPTNFAVVGEKGSGKSSFLSLIVESELEEKEVETVEFTRTIWEEDQLVSKIATEFEVESPQSIEELVTAINGSDQRRVVVLESIQNCFVRNINGFKAIEKLSYLISETRNNIFWMVSCSRYAWSFLDKVLQISEYFSHISKSDSLDAEQVKQVILNRHQASGYSLYFEPDGQTQQSRTYRKLKDQEEEAQEYLKKEYFEKLTKLAEGNVSIAMIFWIRSIRDFDEIYFYIRPLEITSVEMIEDLKPPVLFALAAFVLHDTLSDEELAMVMNITREESRLLLNRLRSRGILIEKNESFTINHLMYRQIVRVLKERNIIHLG